MSPDERYLWDRGGSDADVERLEGLLSRFGHRGAPLARRRPRAAAWTGLAAAAAALVLGLWWLLGGGGGPPAGVRLEVAGGGRVLAAGEWFVATAEASRLELGDVGRIDLDPGSRLKLERADAEAARLYLALGRMRAFVSADARPRFFQVDTPSARCVDLGCYYELTVGEDGAAHVAVTLGKVAFETAEGGEVFIPQGAECRADRGGLGTPRFTDASAAFREALDAFDRGSGAERRTAAERVCELLVRERDTLSVWHLLLDDDSGVKARAEQALLAVAGPPAGMELNKVVAGVPPGIWKQHLEVLWW